MQKVQRSAKKRFDTRSAIQKYSPVKHPVNLPTAAGLLTVGFNDEPAKQKSMWIF